MKIMNSAVAAALFCLVSGNVAAIDNIGLSGFFTVGATKSDSPTASQNGLITNKLGFDQDTRVGIQISAEVNPRINMTAQIIGRGRDSSSGRDNNFSAAFDWGYIDYRINKKLNVRAGKLKLPTYLISDYFEVGYAYPWIRPPQEVYYSNPISAITGIDLLFRTQIGEMDVLIQPYYGTSNGEQSIIPQAVLDIPMFATQLGATPGTVVYTNFTAENFAGINASIGGDINEEGDSFSVRAGYLQTKVSAASFGVSDDQATFASIGGTLDWNNIVVYSEYFEREIKDAANLAFPNQKGWYVTLGYRIGKYLPHVTFATTEDNSNPTGFCDGVPCGTPLDQESVTIGLRYELGAGAALKVEAQKSEPKTGTRGLFLQNPADGGDVTFFSLAVDVVF